MDMTLDEARELLVSPLWPAVRDRFLSGREFAVYPPGDVRRLEYLDEGRRRLVSSWCDAAARLAEWKRIVSGEEVRKIREAFRDVYPEVLRYEAYFAKCATDQERLRMVLRVKFPDVLEMLER